MRLVVLAQLVLINVPCEALLEAIFRSLKTIADKLAGSSFHPIALQRLFSTPKRAIGPRRTLARPCEQSARCELCFRKQTG